MSTSSVPKQQAGVGPQHASAAAATGSTARKQLPCYAFLNGGCQKADRCAFSHVLVEVRALGGNSVNKEPKAPPPSLPKPSWPAELGAIIPGVFYCTAASGAFDRKQVNAAAPVRTPKKRCFIVFIAISSYLFSKEKKSFLLHWYSLLEECTIRLTQLWTHTKGFNLSPPVFLLQIWLGKR